MQSNVCKIEKGCKDLEAILNESERVAKYNNLTNKQTLQLRLLCEEIDGMLPNIIDDFEGTLWIDFEDGICKVNISIYIPEFNANKKEELICISKSKKNAAAVGIVGKIRNTIENFFLSEERMGTLVFPSEMANLGPGYYAGGDCYYLWSLSQYKDTVKKEEQADAWDELEKSVIASVADDVTVGIKGNNAEIIIIKKFQ